MKIKQGFVPNTPYFKKKRDALAKPTALNPHDCEELTRVVVVRSGHVVLDTVLSFVKISEDRNYDLYMCRDTQQHCGLVVFEDSTINILGVNDDIYIYNSEYDSEIYDKYSFLLNTFITNNADGIHIIL